MDIATLFATASHILLLSSIISLWIKRDIAVWGSLLIGSMILGYFSSRLSAVGAFWVLFLGTCYFLTYKSDLKNRYRLIAGILAGILSLLFAAHMIPGFHNWLILENIRFSETSQRYSIYLNLDKPVIGLFILGFGFTLIHSSGEWKNVLRSTLPILFLAISTLFFLSSALGYTEWDIKLSDVFVLWAVKNLFFTCIAEEAFFRGFLQHELSAKLNDYKNGNVISLLSIAILFGLAHFAGGLTYVFLASVAGIFYGYAYQKLQRIEAAILCHFGVNLFHFILLSYPALETG